MCAVIVGDVLLLGKLGLVVRVLASPSLAQSPPVPRLRCGEAPKLPTLGTSPPAVVAQLFVVEGSGPSGASEPATLVEARRAEAFGESWSSFLRLVGRTKNPQSVGHVK
jgi:hypothetical protein